MDQLVVLQEIYESFSKGVGNLQKIDARSIEGSCPKLIGQLLEGSRKGKIDKDLCMQLLNSLQDVYEIKRLGDICRKARLLGLAIRSYNKALALTRDESVRAVLQSNLGQAYACQGDLARAVIYYQKAADGFERAGDSSGLAHVLGNLGSAYRRGKKWDKAIENCYRSLKTFEERGDELGIAQMMGSLGRIFAEMGERELAQRYFEKSLKDFQRLGDKKSSAWVLDRLGRNAFEREEWDKALGCYNRSLELFEELGHNFGAGIVLCNMGRMHLQLNQPAAARECLEKALKFVPKSAQPAYQNIISALAATYSALARECLHERTFALIEPKNSQRESISEGTASKYYAKASDRYLELDSMQSHDLPSIKAAAGITRCRSYLAKLQEIVPEDQSVFDQSASDQSVAIMEMAAAALDTAAAYTDGSKKAKMQCLQRTLCGMKEVWSIGSIGSEPWGITNALSNATEYLLGGACISSEAVKCLSNALQNLSESIEAENARKDPAEKLIRTVNDLRAAKRLFASQHTGDGNDSASKADRAANIIEGWECALAARRETNSQSSTTDVMDFRPHRSALLLISWVLANSTLQEVDDTTACYSWDESLNLVDGPLDLKAAKDIEVDRSDKEPEPNPIIKACRPLLVLCRDGSSAQEAIFEDAKVEPSVSSMDYASAAGYLVAAKTQMACPSSAQIMLHLDEPMVRVTLSPEMQKAKIESEEGPSRIITEQRAEEIQGNGVGKSVHSPKQESFSGSPLFSSQKLVSDDPLSRYNAIMLLKVLLVVAVLLLALEVVLYLI
jgi:tetratricopeptide (TPR) repeat protein